MRLRSLVFALGGIAPLAMVACASRLAATVQTTPDTAAKSLTLGINNPWPEGPKGQHGDGVPDFYIRAGYRVDLVASVQNARFMEIDDKGVIYLTRPDRGDIQTFKWQDGKLNKLGTFVTGHPTVHGMHFYDGWLWFTTSGGIFKARDTNGDGVADEVKDVIPEGTLPHGGHWWRSILVTKDGFFTSIGDAGNDTDLRNSDREKIWFYDLDGKNKKLWCGGIRNTEKLRYRPGTTELYGWDQGSDNFGQSLGENTGHNQPITDQVPPEEFNKYVEGGFYGHPFILGNGVPRYDWLNKPGVDIIQLAKDTILPEFISGPHWAADGWSFLNSNGLGEGFKGDALVAFHGSWNRVQKAGYRVSRIMFDKVTGQPCGMQMLVGTLGTNGQTLARPTDVLEMPDGSVLWSDDAGGRIFRLSAAK